MHYVLCVLYISAIYIPIYHTIHNTLYNLHSTPHIYVIHIYIYLIRLFKCLKAIIRLISCTGMLPLKHYSSQFSECHNVILTLYHIGHCITIGLYSADDIRSSMTNTDLVGLIASLYIGVVYPLLLFLCVGCINIAGV